MGALPQNFSTPFVVASLILAVAGGLYFGMFACGAYAWHRWAFWLAFGTTLLVAVLAPSRLMKSKLQRLAFPVGIAAVFLLVQAATAPFYPTTPTSAAEFVRIFIHTLKYGPC